MATFEEIKKAKAEQDLSTEVDDLPEGYLVGGALSFANEIAYINPVIAKLQGKLVYVPQKTRFADCSRKLTELGYTTSSGRQWKGDTVRSHHRYNVK